MAEIKQLSMEVANQISAGEVIERPASVVKELVENAIDAGSDNILIEVDDGGKEHIRVKDNGSGIQTDQLELAFSRYATSKINEINDLYSLHSLGFRGEALSSIAAVSRVKIKTRAAGELKGCQARLSGGELLDKKITGCPVGTDIIVEDLFYNTPARYKYLKTINTEFGHISDVITREALAYPEIQFILRHNNKQVLGTPGTGQLKDTIYALYGRELAEKLIPVDFEDRYVQVTGYIARPVFYRSSRVYEMFFVNRRAVYNRSLYQGVEDGYRGLLSPGSYPAVFLNIKLNSILVDVNVHPTKREIKFSREEIIRDIISQGIKKKLLENNPVPRMKITGQKPTGDSREQTEKLFSDQLTEGDPVSYQEKADDSIDFHKVKDSNKLKDYREDKNSIQLKDNPGNKESELNTASYRTEDYKQYSKSNQSNIGKKVKSNIGQKVKLLGQIHQTYLVTEAEDGLYLIDQHTAHERILYDSYLAKYQAKSVGSQALLVPLTIELTLSELEVINNNIQALEELGLKVELFGGNSIIVHEIPTVLKKRSAREAILELIDNLIQDGKTMNQAELIDEIITYMSCRGAVKAGDLLQREEQLSLVDGLFKSSNPYRCPHGRPIIIHLTEHDLEKGFGRI